MPARQEWILILKAIVSFVGIKDALREFLQGPLRRLFGRSDFCASQFSAKAD